MAGVKWNNQPAGFIISCEWIHYILDTLYPALDVSYYVCAHMGSEGRLYSSKSTNGGKGLKNSKINSYFTP